MHSWLDFVAVTSQYPALQLATCPRKNSLQCFRLIHELLHGLVTVQNIQAHDSSVILKMGDFGVHVLTVKFKSTSVTSSLNLLFSI